MSGMLLSSVFHLRHNIQRHLILLSLLSLLVSLSLTATAQQQVTLEWPLNSPDRVMSPNSAAETGFGTGKAVGRVVFDRIYGAMASGWDTEKLNPGAFYEYRVIPAEGARLEFDRLSLALSLGGGGMNAAIRYSTDGFRQQVQELGQPVFFYTTDPQTLALSAAMEVSYPDTLRVRVYAWGAAGPNTEFNNLNFKLEGIAFGSKEIPKPSSILATYTAIASGNWNDPATWDLGAVPGASDDITINTGVTVTMNVDGSCQSILNMLGTSSIVAGGGTLTLLNSSAKLLFHAPLYSPMQPILTLAAHSTSRALSVEPHLCLPNLKPAP